MGGGVVAGWAQAVLPDWRRVIAASTVTSPVLVVLRRDTVLRSGVDPSGGYHANFDVTPDGRAFVFPRRTDPPAEWIFTHGWGHALRSRRGRARPE